MDTDQKVLDKFYNIVSESKQEKYNQIASDRTRYLTIVLENIRKEHNASAVLRSCDCFGIQDLHVIEKEIQYEVQRDIALGAGKWVDIYSHTETESPSLDCLNKLKSNGYQIVATTPHAVDSIHDIDISKPIALVFGTERTGVSKEVLEKADLTVKIPMYGFTESFNISVSAAIAMTILRNKLEKSNLNWKLSDKEQTLLKIKWCASIIKEGEKVEELLRKRTLTKD